uniref:Uncharacterized protein n=1 Tax=Acartia pacifica TaxID=335913 RepID=A0A0U2USH7_ACAPC|nr:hypothetical protein [Acartia pacifica]
MGRVFSWEYFSFLNIDEAAAYKEMLILPVLVVLLFFIWMKLVNNSKTDTSAKEGLDIRQAYEDALANEVDSGTELDSPDEAEEKDDAEKKDD